ncbi:hypothetical protein B6I21_01205, partial [candidate division KSB1 bacterium 4572_119]
MKFKLLIIALIIISLPQLVASQDANWNFLGAGARARGMGGAFIGVADDATAASWNPAGLVRLEAAEASVVGLYESYTPESDVDDFDADPYQSSHFGLNFISAAFPLSVGDKNIVAAVAYQNVLDLFYSYDGDSYASERTGGVNAIVPSIGIQLTPAISVGASVNIYTGSTDYTYEDKTGYYSDVDATWDYAGTNFTVGGLFDFDKFRFGVVLKTPFGLTETGEDEENILNLPQMLGFGVAYAMSENLTLAFDYDMRNYSAMRVEDEDGDEYDPDFEDLNQLRVGAEYLYMAGTNVLPIRLGFATTPLPYKDDNDDQIVGFAVTGGVGIIMGNINLDLGLEYNKYSYEYDTGYDTYEYSDNYLRFIVS